MEETDDPRATIVADNEAEDWAAELERWCLIREKFIERRDTSAARQGRSLVGQLRRLSRSLREARLTRNEQALGALLEELGECRRLALQMMRSPSAGSASESPPD